MRSPAEALLLGLSSREVPLEEILTVGQRIAEATDGERVGVLLPALLLHYYIAVVHDGDPEKPLPPPEELAWFVNEASFQITSILRAKQESEDPETVKH